MDEFTKGFLKGVVPPSIPWGIIISTAIYRAVALLNIQGLEWLFFLLVALVFTFTGVMFGLFGLLYALDYDAFVRWSRNTTITMTIMAFIIIVINLLLWR